MQKVIETYTRMYKKVKPYVLSDTEGNYIFCGHSKTKHT
jgi:hypothetical protein